MFKIEQQVKVTDQSPPAEGVVIEISTWRKVFDDEYGSNDTCYRIECQDWQPPERWIAAGFVKAL